MVPELVAAVLVLGVGAAAGVYDGTRFFLAGAAADLLLGVAPAATGAVVLSAPVAASATATGLFIGGESLFGLLVVAAFLPRPPSWLPGAETCLELAPVALLIALFGVAVVPARVEPGDPAVLGIGLTVAAVYYFGVARRALDGAARRLDPDARGSPSRI